ncbi:hypothetical protein TYRP_001750 [Tyrophagus putrescentiae]|nr:hypothetical protein TYRP_001750 [Tyrophagus putrescentiae]
MHFSSEKRGLPASAFSPTLNTKWLEWKGENRGGNDATKKKKQRQKKKASTFSAAEALKFLLCYDENDTDDSVKHNI